MSEATSRDQSPTGCLNLKKIGSNTMPELRRRSIAKPGGDIMKYTTWKRTINHSPEINGQDLNKTTRNIANGVEYRPFGDFGKQPYMRWKRWWRKHLPTYMTSKSERTECVLILTQVAWELTTERVPAYLTRLEILWEN